LATSLYLLSAVLFSALPGVLPKKAAAAVPPSRYIIKLQNNNPAKLAAVAEDFKQKFTFSQNPQFSNIYEFSSTLPLLSLEEELRGSYVYIEEETNYKLTVAVITTNDPAFTLNPLDIDRQWGLVKAGFPAGWVKTTGSLATKVAVIDTGVDVTHEDLRRANFLSGFDVTTGQNILSTINSDDNGHGTLVTGIISAVPNNGLGLAGTNWQVSVMPVKALDASGSGSSLDLAEGIVWATDHGANIINLSLGGIGFAHDATLSNAISYAYNKDVVIVAAAGNDVAITGGNLDVEPVFPICNDNGQNMIIGVAASDQNDLKADFSNFGKSCIDVVAPGKRILSTTNHDPVTGNLVPNAYAYASGTSLATPYVTGQTALLRSLFPKATNSQIRDRIISTADNIDSLNLSQCSGLSCKGYLGAGRINVVRSLAEEIVIQSIVDGDLVSVGKNSSVYLISGGKKGLISPFVYSQRFSSTPVKQVQGANLDKFLDGPYAEPLDGTLVKLANDPTVYYMSKGLRLPVLGSVFALRQYKFSDVVTLSYSEINSWLQGSFLSPPEGTLVRTPKNQTVYWTVSGLLHPINFGFYTAKGLQVFGVNIISDADVKGLPKGEAYIQ